MNRLILLGNGFDLAHGMKTSYKNFIEHLWIGISKYLEEKLREPSFEPSVEDHNKLIKIKNPYSRGEWGEVHKAKTIDFLIDKDTDGKPIEISSEAIKTFADALSGSIQSKFFRIISKNYINKNWSDIEADYYKELLDIINAKSGKNYIDRSVKTLNNEFKQIKDLLKEYLRLLDKRSEEYSKIEYLFYSYVSPKDIGLSSWDVYVDDVSEKMEQYCNDEKLRNRIGYRNDESEWEPLFATRPIARVLCKDTEDCKRYTNMVLKQFEEYERDTEKTKDIADYSGLLPRYFLIPENIMFLNFNYTQTEVPYITPYFNPFWGENKIPRINHIHGTLDDCGNNRMIFGYGDEEADEYKEIEKSDTPQLLDNVKSINYLESSNYRDMERFIESGPYQLFLVGISCGLADRTMLRKLFQHKNCISIKPFYHRWEENGKKKDNYTEIIQNISRCFSDKDLLRSIVVNKQHCEPLPQITDKGKG
ncbi:MAG: hypothetical protein RL662_1846 [Bacteroidota bacterium]|jgi:hypothetical protein